MQLNKDNYEFLMFELLEGNLNEKEKNTLLTQINKDAFYQREWSLMQLAVATPQTVIMANKKELLKPEGRLIPFVPFTYFTKIAASLLLLGIAGWWYYTFVNEPVFVHKSSELKYIPRAPVASSKSKSNSDMKQIKGDERKANMETITPVYSEAENPLVIQDVIIDSVMPVNLPEILLIKPLKNEGIAYDIKPNEVAVQGYLGMDKPKKKDQNKLIKLLAQADKIRTTANDYWNDIPNLKFKITPRLKDKKPTIGIEIKGETIYANALLEIK